MSVHVPAPAVAAAAAVVGLQWKADESGGGFTEMNHEADVQLMLQLCSKDSPAVPRISLCAYVIRLHGTAARAGASDPTNVQHPGMRWEGEKKIDKTLQEQTVGTHHVTRVIRMPRRILILLFSDM